MITEMTAELKFSQISRRYLLGRTSDWVRWGLFLQCTSEPTNLDSENTLHSTNRVKSRFFFISFFCSFFLDNLKIPCLKDLISGPSSDEPKVSANPQQNAFLLRNAVKIQQLGPTCSYRCWRPSASAMLCHSNTRGRGRTMY